MGYAQATARLRRAITKVAATGAAQVGDRPGGLRRCRPGSAYITIAPLSQGPVQGRGSANSGL
jgi:hypothetical protein